MILKTVSIGNTKRIWQSLSRGTGSWFPFANRSRHALHVVYKYLFDEDPWECSISHIVPRDFAFDMCTTNTSRFGVGANAPAIKAWCVIPFAPSLVDRAYLLSSHPDYIQINVFEYLGVLVCHIMVTEYYPLYPDEFPPTPTVRSYCDNTAAIS